MNCSKPLSLNELVIDEHIKHM